MPFLTIGDLQGWASKDGAKENLPAWVGRLVENALLSKIERRFLHGAATNLPGVDGKVLGAIVRTGLDQFVPQGDSVWEFSVSSPPDSKIVKDAQKLIDDGVVDNQTTVVFVTPRGLKDPDGLKRRIAASANWKEVRIIDGTRLHDWLVLAPAIALEWAGHHYGIPTSGLRTLDQAWQVDSGRTIPTLTEELIISGREDAKARLLAQLGSPPRHIYVRGDSAFEAQAFVLAVMKLAATEQDRNRTLVGLNYEFALSVSCFARSIIIVRAGGQGTTSKLENDGHHVVVAYGDLLPAPPDVIELERPDRWAFSKALENLGLDEHDALRIAREVGSSVTVMSRLRAHGLGDIPWWAKGDHAELLRPFCLLGQWDASNAEDRKIVEMIAAEPWEEIQQKLAVRLVTEDAPLARATPLWALGSHVDVFTLLAPGLGDVHFLRFAEAVRLAFRPQSTLTKSDANDDAFSTPKGVSEWLRDGLAQALLLLAVRGPRNLSCPMPTGSGHSTPDVFVERLLAELASLADYRQLYSSIKRQYSVLIEAGPDPLLEALERWLEGSPDDVRVVLASKRGFLAEWSDLTEMLWGLESLAWSPGFLPRVASVLAKLAILQPEEDSSGRRENKALDVLSRILMWWSPQTFASLDQRNAILDQVLHENSELGWALLLALRPTGHMTQAPTAKPRLRDFAPDKREVLTRRIVYEGLVAVVSRVLDHAGADASRLVTIVEGFAHFPPDLRTEALRRLKVQSKGLNITDRTALWAAIRDETARHRQFAKAEWALDASELQQWEELQRSLAPSDPVAECKWLFDEWLPALPEELAVDRDVQPILDQRRQDAVAEVLAKYGQSGVLELAERANLPNSVGFAAGAVLKSIDDVIKLTGAALESVQISEQFISALLWSASGRFSQLVETPNVVLGAVINWAQSNDILATRIASAFAWLPFNPSTLQFVESLSVELAEAYWKHAPVPYNAETELIAGTLERFIAAGRAGELSQMVSFGKMALGPEQLLRLLDAAIDEIAKGKWGRPHALQEFLKYLARRLDVPDDELIQREIVLVPLLGYYHGIPLRLYRSLCNEPSLFVAFVKQIYKRAAQRSSEPTEDVDENAKQLATRAYQVLSSWHHQLNAESENHTKKRVARSFPGENSDGIVDADALNRWVVAVRELAAEEDRSEVADAEIGHLLAYSPFDGEDHGWPSQAVRSVLEQNWSESLSRGICTEHFNKRGAHGVEKGGVQEEALRDRARSWAEIAGYKWPKTRRVLDDIARMWEGERKRALEWDEVRKLKDRAR